MPPRRKQRDEDKRKRGDVPTLPKSSSKPGRQGSSMQKAARALDADDDVDVTTDRVDLPKTLAAAHSAIISLQRKWKAEQAAKKKLEEENERLRAENRLLRRVEDDAARGFEGVGSDDDLSPTGFGSDDDLSPTVALSPEDTECLKICALARQRRLWRTLEVPDTVEKLFRVAAKLELSHGDVDAPRLLVERSGLVAKLRDQLSRAAFVGDDASSWELRGCTNAAQCYDAASRKNLGRDTIDEAWFLASKTPYDGPKVFEALPLKKWCQCDDSDKCVVGFAEETPRTLFRRNDGVVDKELGRVVGRHYAQIEALRHMRRCHKIHVESGTAPDLEAPVKVEMPTKTKCLCALAHASVARAAPLVDALKSLRKPFQVLTEVSKKWAFGGGHGKVKLLVTAGSDVNELDTMQICVCNVRRTINTDCTSAASRRHEDAKAPQRNTSGAENANVRVWHWMRDSQGVTLYMFDPLTGKLFRRLVRKAGCETKHPELAPYVEDVSVGDFFPDIFIELSSYAEKDALVFKIGGGHVRVKSIVKVEASQEIRSKEMDAPQATYITEDYDLTQTTAKNYALAFCVVFPSTCRYATIDHILGDRADHSIGMLHSVSTSENSRVKEMVDKEGGYDEAQALYARMFPAAAATA